MIAPLLLLGIALALLQVQAADEQLLRHARDAAAQAAALIDQHLAERLDALQWIAATPPLEQQPAGPAARRQAPFDRAGLQAALSQLALPAGATLVVYDSANAATPLIESLGAATHELAATPHGAVFTESPRLAPWRVTVELPDAARRTARLQAASVAAAALAGAALLAVLVAKRTSRRLHSAVEALEHGGPSDAATGIAEIDAARQRLHDAAVRHDTAEATLRDSEQRLRRLFDKAPVAQARVSASSGVIEVNERFVELLGWTPAEIRTLDDWWPRAYPDPAYRAEVRSAWSTTLTAARDTTPLEQRERQIHCRDGRVLWMEIAATVVGGDLLVHFIDVTARHRAEAAVLAANADLERRVAERTAALERAMHAAEAASRAKSSFLGNMSHEIRTPLNAIVGFSHLLRRSATQPQDVSKLDRIAEAAQQLLRLVGDVLDLSKLEAGDLRLQPGPFAPDELLRALVDQHRTLATAKGLGFELRAAGLPPTLLGDAPKLSQALGNLLDNAVKFTERGRIDLQVEVLERDGPLVLLRFEVSDTGIGVAPDTIETLFAPFTQADGSMSRRFGGSGLGLAITRRLAVLMDGEAGAFSAPGEGSRFWFTARLSVPGAAAS